MPAVAEGEGGEGSPTTATVIPSLPRDLLINESMYGKYYYIYIMSNKYNTVYYVGITNILDRRAVEHKWKLNKNSFTAKYNINKLLYFEEYDNPTDAIRREKQLKGWRRNKKIQLIKKINPDMEDLFE